MLEYHNIFETFNTTENGLDGNEATYRQKKYGPNQLTGKAEKPIIFKLLEEFIDPMILLLIFASGIALFNGDVTDALLIFFVVLLNGIIGFIQKYRAEKAIEALKKMVAPQARVFRNKQQILLNTVDIVPGDIIVLNEGDTVPADAIVFQSNELEASESMISGESNPIGKKSFNVFEKGALTSTVNYIYMGTTISRGNAHALVIKTGMETEFGKIANLTQTTVKDKTPLQKEIHKIGIFAAQITIVIVGLIFAFEYIFHHRNLIDNLIFSSSVAVAAVPESLPAVITITLAFGVMRLSKKKAIIRQLSSVETLGATTVICTDKTGTLTKNEMTVTEAMVDEYYLDIDGIGYDPIGKFKVFEPNKSAQEFHQDQITPDFIKKNPALSTTLRMFCLCAKLCNNSTINNKNNIYSIIGDPTEGALLVMAKKLNFFLEEDHSDNLQEIHELPFDSDRKIMTKIIYDKKHNKYFAFSKGAPDQLIKLCDQRLYHGKTVILTKGIKDELLTINEQYNENALRTIALAYKEIPGQQLQEILYLDNFEDKIKAIEKKLVYLGIAGLSDPPREEVKHAVELTKLAGIRNYIITGDHGFTTAAIAKQLGMISEKTPYEIITGDDLDSLSDEDLRKKLSNKELNIIFSRNKPEHKLRIVSLIKQNNEIVAVTGDGVNDAPALKRADIGIAMGVNGSDVSKEASNMILMDDSFSTIVVAIQEGRTIYANLKKFIFYIFSSNIGELTTIFVSLLIGLNSPISAILILTVNFVTDLFPALALAVEPMEKNIMSHKPRSPDEKIMNRQFISRIMIIGGQIGLLMIGLYLYKLISQGWGLGQPINPEWMPQISSLIFAGLVFTQIANSFNARTETESIFLSNPFNNKSLILANLFSAAIAIAIIQWAPLQGIFKTAGLNWLDWLLVILSCIFITVTLEIIKYIKRHSHKHFPANVNQNPATT